MAILRDEILWGLVLKKLRQRQNLKQEAAAALLGISQAYVSRLEQGYLQPSLAVQERITQLLEGPEARPAFEDWSRGLAISEGISSIICHRKGDVRLVEFSAGFRSLGGNFATIEHGMPLNGSIGKDADVQFARLEQLGLFEGALSAAESIWSTQEGGTERFMRSRSVPVRDELGEWNVFSTHNLISKTEYRARLKAGSEVLVLPDGEIRIGRASVSGAD